LESKISKLL